jgi:hypothetical protein
VRDSSALADGTTEELSEVAMLAVRDDSTVRTALSDSATFPDKRGNSKSLSKSRHLRPSSSSSLSEGARS